MDDELTPPEEQQPSNNRFLDAAREAKYSINAPTPHGPDDETDGAPSYATDDWVGSSGRDTSPAAKQSRLEEFRDGYQGKERGLKQRDFTSPFEKEGAKKQAGALAKATAELPQKSALATAANAKRMGTFAKNKKWFALGGAGLATLIPIAMFFFWLMLFKNVHIKNLYVTYRWAQFNRGVNRSLKQELTKAKEAGKTPKGSAETVIPDDAATADIIEKANASEVGPDKFDPTKDADIEREGRRTSSTQKSVEGSSQQAAEKLGYKRAIKPATDAKEASQNVTDELADAGKSDDLKPKGKLSEATEDAQKIEEGGKSAKAAANEAADNLMKGGFSGLAELVQKATGPFVVATFYCIFRDIYIEAKQQVSQIVIGGASTVAQEVNKTADCQVLGKCSLDQAGAVANKFDDGKESASDTCGWKLAEGSDVAGCTKINPKYTVKAFADTVGGPAGDAIKVADQTFDIQSARVTIPAINVNISAGPAQFCPVVLNSWVQGGVAVANLVAIATSGGGWGAAGEAIAGGAAAAAATTGGKALIAHAILTYSGGLFKDLTPHDIGNLTDMGNLATASATCKAAGCVKVTPEMATSLNNEYRQEVIAKNQNRSVLAKFFDTSSSDSVLVRAAIKTPTTPQAIIGRMGNVFASISNPLKLNKALGNTSLAFSADTAMAADQETNNPYGIGEYVPANVAYDIDASEADSFYTNLDAPTRSSLEETYKKCNTMEQEAFIEDLGSQKIPAECNTNDYHKFAAAKFNQSTVSAWARSHNKQTSTEAAPSSSSGATDDTTGINADDNTVGTPCPAGTTSAGSARTYRGSTIGLCNIGDNTIVNTSAAKAFYDMKQAAARDGIKLYGGGFRSYEEQVRLRKQNCGSGWATVSPSSCNPPTARPGKSNHEVGLAIDFKNSSSRGSAVYRWLSANAKRFGIENLPTEAWHWSVDGR